MKQRPGRHQALRETYPQAELYIFHNAVHASLFTQYDEYLAMTRRFLAGEFIGAGKKAGHQVRASIRPPAQSQLLAHLKQCCVSG